MKELGISGGTFNPIHNWHLVVAECARVQFDLGKVLMIPNGTPAHKKHDILDAELRFEMVEAAATTNPFFEASRIEIDRDGPSYLLDTLKQLRAEYGDGVRLNFFIGVDNIAPLPTWYKADEIFGLCRLLIAPRMTVSRETILEMTKTLPAHASFEIIEAPSSGTSSTLIREWIRAGRNPRYLVPDVVYSILAAKGHYKS
jgi:nicotinate-nucleotide adenylyltransferase